MTSTELRERYPRASGLPAFDEALAALEAAEACNSALEATLEDLYSAEPCPKCGAGVTGACWGCVAAKYRARAEQLEAALRELREAAEEVQEARMANDVNALRTANANLDALLAPKEASDGQQ